MNFFLVFFVLSFSIAISTGFAEGAELICPVISGNYTYVNGSAYLEEMPFQDGELSIFSCEYDTLEDSEELPFGEIVAVYNFTGELTSALIQYTECGSTLGNQFHPMFVSSITHFASVAFSTTGLIYASSELMTQIEEEYIGDTCAEELTESSTEQGEEGIEEPVIQAEPTMEISNEAIKEKPIEEIIEKVAEFQKKDDQDIIQEKIVIKLDENEKISKIVLPDWIKKNAEWWSKDQITDDEFYKGIEYLINNGIIRIPLTAAADQSTNEIPGWVKKNAALSIVFFVLV